MKRWLGTVLMMGLCGAADVLAQQSLAEANRMGAAVAEPAPADVRGPATTLDDALRLMFAEADVVFIGTVLRVEPVEGAVLIQFSVEDAVRGVADATYTLREWNGLWADDAQRYVVGERRMMLLHAASAAGYASPVGGSRGAIRLRGDAVQGVADLRWVAADVMASPTSLQAMSVSQAARLAAVTDRSAVDGTLLRDMLHAWMRDGVTR